MGTSQHTVKNGLRDKDARVCPGCGNRMVRRSKQCRDCTWKRPIIQQPSDPSKRFIALTLGKIAIVDASDYERISKHRWAAKRIKRCDGSAVFYAVRTQWVNGKTTFIQMHRFILGVGDPLIQVDHRNPKDTLNNCRENLRFSTPSQNQANRIFRKSSSGYKGVAIIRSRPGRRHYDGWRGEITVNGRRMVSKIFRSPEPAARWYDTEAKKHFGEFARGNFPDA